MLLQSRAVGYHPAPVAQDGLKHLTMPWADNNAVFIGGSTGWKCGPAAAGIAADARARGKWIHMGRMNSRRRLQQTAAIGCHPVEGTYLAVGPDRNLPRLLGWLADLNRARTTNTADNEVAALPAPVPALADRSARTRHHHP